MLKLLYFVSVSLVVLCRIYSATYNNKTTRKLEITKQSLSVNLELANKYTVTKTEKKKLSRATLTTYRGTQREILRKRPKNNNKA